MGEFGLMGACNSLNVTCLISFCGRGVLYFPGTLCEVLTGVEALHADFRQCEQQFDSGG